jgi:hypothetical protein
MKTIVRVLALSRGGYSELVIDMPATNTVVWNASNFEDVSKYSREYQMATYN